MLLKNFWMRWKQEYLTSFREFHKTTGNNVQKIEVRDKVVVHDDVPKVNCRLTVTKHCKQVIKGRDAWSDLSCQYSYCK